MDGFPLPVAKLGSRLRESEAQNLARRGAVDRTGRSGQTRALLIVTVRSNAAKAR
jgi:hypothetical protein